MLSVDSLQFLAQCLQFLALSYDLLAVDRFTYSNRQLRFFFSLKIFKLLFFDVFVAKLFSEWNWNLTSYLIMLVNINPNDAKRGFFTNIIRSDVRFQFYSERLQSHQRMEIYLFDSRFLYLAVPKLIFQFLEQLMITKFMELNIWPLNICNHIILDQWKLKEKIYNFMHNIFLYRNVLSNTTIRSFEFKSVEFLLKILSICERWSDDNIDYFWVKTNS